MGLWNFPDAREEVLAHVAPLQPETLAIELTVGRCLAEPFYAKVDNPPFTNSAVDGFALRLADMKAEGLALQGTVAAGDSPTPLKGGHCVEVFTGAPMPEGADSVVMIEDADVQGKLVRFAAVPALGANVRQQASEYREGDALFPAQTAITPPVLALLAFNGVPEIAVRRAPRVAILATGSELASPGSPRSRYQIYNSNGPGVAAAVREIGGNVVLEAAIEDNATALGLMLREALDASDLVITSGGVSVGERDFVKDVWKELGARQIIWGVRMRPGKPFYFGELSQKLIFGLPGNPVSALVCFQLFCRPALQKALGYGGTTWLPIQARLEKEVRPHPSRTDFQRGSLTATADGFRVKPLEPQASHELSGLALANALVIAPPSPEPIPAGSWVDVVPLEWSASI